MTQYFHGTGGGGGAERDGRRQTRNKTAHLKREEPRRYEVTEPSMIPHRVIDVAERSTMMDRRRWSGEGAFPGYSKVTGWKKDKNSF